MAKKIAKPASNPLFRSDGKYSTLESVEMKKDRDSPIHSTVGGLPSERTETTRGTRVRQ